MIENFSKIAPTTLTEHDDAEDNPSEIPFDD